MLTFYQMSSQITITPKGRSRSSIAAAMVRNVRKHRAAAFAKKRAGTTSLIVRPGRSLAGAQILPDRLTTVLESSGSFYVPASNMAAAAGNYMNIVANSIYQPFQGGYPVNTAVNTYSMHGSWVQGYTGTQNPIGYTGVAALYSLYKVKRVKLQVTCQTQAGGDTTQLVVFPIGSEAIPSAAAGSTNLQVMLGQPHNKTVVCASGSSAKTNTVYFDMLVHDILGRRKAQWEDVDGTAIGSQPPAVDQAFFGVFAQILDGATNGSPVVFSVRMWQYVELTDLIQQIN